MLRVVMLLAHSDDAPQGDVGDGYEITLALAPDGRLDAGAWTDAWRVRRFTGSGADRAGALVRLDGGWAIRYDDGEAEMLPDHLAGRVFRPGEYVTLRPPGGPERVYRIVGVTRHEAGAPSFRAGGKGWPGA